MPSDELAPPALARWEVVERIGEGASSVVWRVRSRQGEPGWFALKVARDAPSARQAAAREAAVLARLGRRWGPALVDVAPGYLVTRWAEGAPLGALPRDGAAAERTRRVAIVAHAVARALEELHEAGAFHGDVKPDNVLYRGGEPAHDAAEDRVATLVDLGLAGDLGTSAHGGTPRYAAPELRDRGEAGPSADLWALGVLLGELLDPAVRESASPAEAIARSRAVRDGAEPARWIDALLAASPGGRPSAAWVARRAAAWLGLGQDEAEIQQARVERVRRTYLSVRATDLVGGSVVDAAIAGPARTWLEGALSWIAKAGDEGRVAATIQPLGALRTTRWLAALVGPSAVHWRLRREATAEGPLATRLLELAKRRDPAQWTLAEVGIETGGDAISTGWQPGEGEGRLVALAQQLARPVPSPVAIDAAESDVLSTRSMAALAVPLARALARAGDVGRAWAILDRAPGAEAEALRADLARRRGQTVVAAEHARRAMESKDVAVRAVAAATLGRLAWDRGDLDEADRCVAGHSGAAVAEVRALVAWRRGATERAVEELEGVLSEPLDLEPRARLEAARGMLEMARGNGASAASAFSSAVEYATQCGAIVEEATYLTSEAAAATDLGDMSRALSTATRAALLWERIGRPAQAARAWLARAGALATIGARHAVDEAVEEVESRADASGDARARAYAWWARIEVRSPGDAVARDLALQADAVLAGDREDRARSAARLLVWAPDAMDEARLVSTDEEIRSMSAPARWEWWGARALAILAGRRSPADGGVLAALLALVEVPAPLWSRGPALDAAARLATERGDGEAARRLEAARQLAARTLRSGTPAEHLVSLAGVSWARASSLQPDDVTFAPAQVEQLESIVRSLSGRDRLRPLLEQVLDTLVLWTGVERGVLLMRAPDDRLVPRAARNLARRDLVGDQLVLSQTIARRAIEEGTAVVATDAFSTLGDVHASVHALKLRSVLAVPLVARGETLGVVYLDDRGRKGAFGPRELAWVRVVASQAAMAIADARDAVLLRRAARRAERARVRIEAMLAERDAELTVTRDELERTRDSRETRYAYDEIAGRSEPMRELLRLVDRVTVSEVPVLVVGESGTGKELVARAVHRNGPRSRRPFVSENCASVPETLLESTLFGHVRGAFTGASSTRAGLFDVADGGTLFLDEIGEMPMSMQAKLLRVLQDGVVRPVGGERERKVDVRVIAATHRDLEAMVAAGTFREDLLYRLNVITLRVPPLRERPTDIPLLVEHLVAKHGGSARVKVTRAAMAKLTSFPWPGNVRQLENEVRRALVLGDGVIDVPELSAEVARGGASAARGGGGDLRSRVDALEAELVADALHKTRGNQTRAAQMLGLSRFGLQKMMKRLKVKAPANG